MKIESFREEHAFLSNFFPCIVMYDGRIFPSSEHAYQAMKFPPEQRDAFLTVTAGKSKRMGKAEGIRKDWDEVREIVMEEIIRAKFTQNSDLGKLLIATGNIEIVEGNTWNDTFWGVCNGVGKNKLGKIIMKIRNEIKDFSALL